VIKNNAPNQSKYRIFCRIALHWRLLSLFNMTQSSPSGRSPIPIHLLVSFLSLQILRQVSLARGNTFGILRTVPFGKQFAGSHEVSKSVSMMAPSSQQQQRQDAVSSRILARLRAGELVDQDDEQNEDEEEEDEEEEDEKSSSSPAKDETRLSTPVPLVMRAKFGRDETILDQKVEIEMQRRRTIAMVKDNLRRSLPNKPPVSLMQILHDGRVLGDDETLDQLLLEQEEEDDDDDDHDEGEEDKKQTLQFTVDMVPPVEGKFTKVLEEQVNDLTTAELLRLYAVNEAALHEMSLSLHTNADSTAAASSISDEDDEDEEQEDDDLPTQQTTLVAPRIQHRADQIESQLRTLLQNQKGNGGNNVESILAETRPPSAIQAVTEIRGERVIHAVPSRGVTTSLRRQIQHNFNVQSWSDTIRYICLFIIFGLFGGRTPSSRLILLLGAPSVLFFQARPVKLLWKHVLYTLINDPPGILLSMLPAPQQALFHLDMAQAMQDIYGDHTAETKVVETSANAEEFFDAEEEEFFDAQQEEEEEEDDDELDDDEEEEGEEYELGDDDDEEDEDDSDDDDW